MPTLLPATNSLHAVVQVGTRAGQAAMATALKKAARKGAEKWVGCSLVAGVGPGTLLT